MKLEEFLDSKLSNYASYDTLRKIGNLVDGLKNASRKVMYTVHEKKIKEKTKVLQLANKSAEFSDYLHGDLSGVCVTLAQDFAGTNNIPLLKKSGSFGTRSIKEASAPRYIYASGSEEFFKMFKYEDDEVIIQQTFEGNKIEPRFYVPTLPLLVINGSEGISTGFAQKILGRNPDSIKKYITNKLTNKPIRKEWLNPFFKGFNGTFEQDQEIPNKYYIKGKISHIKQYDYLIEEIPYTYDLQSYLKVLDDLSDNKVIVRYEDLSNGENLLQFKVTVPKGIDTSENSLLERLKLIKPLTENYTCIDENNKVKIFNNVQEILDEYIQVKLKYMTIRKETLVNKITTNLDILKSKLEFVKNVIENRIVINKKSKEEIIKQIENNSKIIKVDNSYDYLLRMPIYSLTKEKITDLEKEINLNNTKLNDILNTSIENMWINDLEEI